MNLPGIGEAKALKIIEYRKQIINKLEEYKKSLIYEVITGKKEVQLMELKEIKLEAAQIRQNAMNDAIKIHENLKTQINDEIVNNSLQIASELLKRNISNDDNQQFVNDFIKNLESNKQDD